jgi:ABC-type lipoprotein release transport system permease subunit
MEVRISPASLGPEQDSTASFRPSWKNALAKVACASLLGATPSEVARLVASDGARWTVVGAVVGVAASTGLPRLPDGLLWSEHSRHPGVADAIAVLVAVAILAAWLPAQQASKIDPMVALRHD